MIKLFAVMIAFFVVVMPAQAQQTGNQSTRSPYSYESSPYNYQNSPYNYRNSPYNYRNSPVNPDSNGVYDSQGNRQGYAVPRRDGSGFNVFSNDGRWIGFGTVPKD